MATSGQHIRSLVVTADGVVSAAPCQFYGITSNVGSTTELWDNASAGSGTRVWAGGGAAMIGGGDSVNCKNGLYVVVGTGTFVTVFFN